jgi:hypothetical protein
MTLLIFLEKWNKTVGKSVLWQCTSNIYHHNGGIMAEWVGHVYHYYYKAHVGQSYGCTNSSSSWSVWIPQTNLVQVWLQNIKPITKTNVWCSKAKLRVPVFRYLRRILICKHPKAASINFNELLLYRTVLCSYMWTKGMNHGQIYLHVLNILPCFHSKIKFPNVCAYSTLHQCKKYIIQITK